ncbi:MAG TPA: hypothetical protein EYN41_08965 [Flavobacteriales bacterium]|nr:hypothetical protein [Flavobacteriales bacterium]
MIYRFLKIVVGLAVKLYFRKITVKNLEFVPNDTPIIFAPNHPGAFMDPIVIASVLKQQLHFLARGESFSNSVSRWIFGNLNMIPIYRPSETPELMHKNKDVFKKACDLLEKKGAIIIFPEGSSKTERRIRKVKTGAVRIAMEAEAQHDYALGVKIIPIGLNYANLHRFKSDVFINIAEPISVSDYAKEYKEDQFGTVNKITGLIQAQLEAHTVVVSEELDQFMREVEEIYKLDLKREAKIDKRDKEGDFRISKDIAEAVAYYHREEPLRLSRIRQKVEDYTMGLKRLELKDHALGKNKSGDALVKGVGRTIIQAILGFPFFLYGAVNNFLPYRIPGIFARMSRPDFHAAVSLSTGIVTFGTFYTLQIWAFDNYVTTAYFTYWATFLYGITLPVTGLFSVIYWRVLIKKRERWHFVSSFYRKTALTTRLIAMREEIIEELNSAKNDYLNIQDNAAAQTNV